METWQAIVLAVVEGLTEYLPISSTGHMILVSKLFGIEQSDFTKDYIVIVQFGAILAAAFYYQKRLRSGLGIYKKVFVAFLPTAIIGFLLKNKVDALLESALTVGCTTLAGGLLLLKVDTWFKNRSHSDLKTIPLKNSVKIGLFQSLAIIPGVSRSAASIIGAQILGLNRTAAAEFSFLLAIPTLTAAAAYKSYKLWKTGGLAIDWSNVFLGNIISFAVGLLTIKLFVEILTRKGFFWFGVYRVALGVAILYWTLT